VHIKRVLNIEDDIVKYIDITRALKHYGIENIDHEDNAEDGIERLVEAIENGEPYDLLILDMHFPVNGVNNEEAGMYVIQQLKEHNISIPIIICSSMRLLIPEVVGCIYYSKSQDLNQDMKKMLDEVKKIRP
jgi:CheY-like chemotaxis protein